MNVTKRQKGDVTILDLKGKITIGAGDIALRDAVHDALNGGAKNVLLNLTVSSFTTATNRGAKLKLANIPNKVNDVLTITQLITVFDVFDTEDEAVASYAS
jgi:anti-anti-sigma regulatory factor